jgi:2-polyprenyl-6-methoxyphenol hydroxylase-like FAD-dependent oxidoreductase
MSVISTPNYDIAIVGGGLSGTLAAVTLGRAGWRVALIDRNEVYPPEFRVEKIGAEQMAKFERLGLDEAVQAASVRFEEIVNIRRGRVLDHTRSPHHGLLYQDLVAAVRKEVPPSVDFLVGRVTHLATSENVQAITIADGAPITARLVVLASGMSDILRSQLGIEREVLRERQSVTFGFDVKLNGNRDLPYPAFTYYGERPADGIDYMSVFPVSGGATRANLFTFLDHRDPWVKAVRTDPSAALAAALPGLTRSIGALEIASKVQNWIMDISVARNVRQPGIVLIGDAYQTSCPAAGTGVSRLLTDVLRLCLTHVPAWFATPGMSALKVAQFYDDADKQAVDAQALGSADFRRSLTIDTTLPWQARRRALYARRGVMEGIERLSPSLARTIRAARSRA